MVGPDTMCSRTPGVTASSEPDLEVVNEAMPKSIVAVVVVPCPIL